MLRQLLATKHPHAAHNEAEGLSLRRTGKHQADQDDQHQPPLGL